MSENDDIDVYMDMAAGTSYIESLAKANIYLSKLYNCQSPIMNKIGQLLIAEIELAILGAEKAKSEILKSSENKIRPIK